MRLVRAILTAGAGLLATGAMPALANLPAFDNTGNGLLNGTYYFREVIYVDDGTGSGNLTQQLSEFGNITFDGNGGYSIANATVNSCSASSGCGQQAFSYNGSYTFAASGYGYFNNPLSSTSATYTNYGLVSNGVLIASATENNFNSLFIAVPTSPTVPAATNASFQGNYQIAGFLPGSSTTSADVLFQLNPDGNGNLGTVNMSGYIAGNGTTATSQSAAAKYNFINGAGVITFPANNNAPFFSGQEYVYISQDHNFVFGGSPQGFDMFVGVKTTTGTVNFGGLYYEAGLDWDATNLASQGFSSLDTFYGSYNAVNGNIIGHERIFYGTSNIVDGFTYTSTYPTSISNGTYTVSNPPFVTQYFFGNSGAIRIGFGQGPSLGINVGMQAPAASGSGVYISSTGVVNAASNAPFTAGVSPGEIIAIYGSNLAPSLAQATTLPLPPSLNGVQVTVNGVPAPLYFVSPGQINCVIPYSAYYTVSSGFPVARIVLTNGSGTSNPVTEFFNLTTPGVFTQNATGLGAGSIFHATASGFSYVTAANPAKPGETVVAYLSGLGATLPSVTEGAPGPTNPPASTTNGFDINVGGTEACGTETSATPCPYVGLAPYLANVYQFNIPIPAAAASGYNSVEIFGPDSDSYQVSIPVGTGTTSTSVEPGVQPDVRAMRPKGRERQNHKPRVRPCFITDPVCSSSGTL